MFTPYLLEHNEKKKVWFTSDLHLGHNKEFLYPKRGYKTIEEHDAGVIKIWNERVAPDDHVVFLGDWIVGAGRDSDDLGNHSLRVLNGTKTMLFGNHNAYVKGLFKRLVKEQYGKENIEVYPIRTDEFGFPVIFMGTNLLCKVRTPTRTQFVFCSHYAHRIWFDSNKGVIALSGHSHGTDKESQADFAGAKRLDVCIENFGGPISFDQVMAIMAKKEIGKPDHHDSSFNPS